MRRAPDHRLALFLKKIRFIRFFVLGIIPKLVNLKLVPDRAAWLQAPGNIYIGRKCRGMREGSIWANPFKIDSQTTREAAIAQYESMLLSNKTLQDALPLLCFCELGCWCVPDMCHGHILINLIKKKLLFDIEII